MVQDTFSVVTLEVNLAKGRELITDSAHECHPLLPHQTSKLETKKEE